MFFTSFLVLLACGHWQPALAAFVLEQVERRHFAVGPQHLQRALLVVLRRLRDAIQVQRDRTCRKSAAETEAQCKYSDGANVGIEH